MASESAQPMEQRLRNKEVSEPNILESPEETDSKSYPMKIIWKNLVLLTAVHIISAYTVMRLPQLQKFTLVYGVICYFLGGLGITAGAHRLWTHRSYKAKLPLRIVLMLFNSLALQNSIFDWTRDHRSHHKFSETNADPHNATRGLFFSHVGWLMVRKHPDVARKGRSISLDDLQNDPVVRFQRRYYIPIAMTCCFVLPTLVPWYFAGETLWNAYCAAMLRYCFTLNATWCINSFAHKYGQKPYDKRIHPSENVFTAYFALGEGFHNYHHTFPHDYATSEYGIKFNLTTAFINVMALFGQAYDCRVIGKEAIEARKRKTGELSNTQDLGW